MKLLTDKTVMAISIFRPELIFRNDHRCKILQNMQIESFRFTGRELFLVIHIIYFMDYQKFKL